MSIWTVFDEDDSVLDRTSDTRRIGDVRIDDPFRAVFGAFSHIDDQGSTTEEPPVFGSDFGTVDVVEMGRIDFMTKEGLEDDTDDFFTCQKDEAVAPVDETVDDSEGKAPNTDTEEDV